MESAQPQITVIIRDVLGGVATYWANLLNELPSQTACVILVRDKHDHYAPTEQLFGCKTLQFEYDGKLENKTSVYRRLVNLVPSATTDIIANESIHLAATAHCCPAIRIHFVLHGDSHYYYQTAERFSDFISLYFCVGNQILHILKNKNIDAAKCCLLPPCIPVPNPPPALKKNSHSNLKIAFIGRFTFEKGFDCVKDSIAQCAEKSLPCEWTIISSNQKHEIAPPRAKNITQIEQCSKATIDNVLRESDVFILPSRVEGFAIVVAEAMRMGVVPVLSDLMVFKAHPFLNDSNSFQYSPDQVALFVEAISELDADRNQLYLMQQRAFRDSAKMLAPDEIASLFTARITLSKPHQTMPRRELCSRLDQSFLPNFLVVAIRTLKQRMKSFNPAVGNIEKATSL
ncbi:MAG: hypothetical protein CBB70_13395 [Planctomycetaceae bacterium TMED10]|nr:MAG: hypothetical protein CBB70_13395 [Planctomycetaceae bacterium TMED10]